MAPDLLKIVEAAYALELPLQEWLLGITRSIANWLNVDGLGAYGFLYSVRADGGITPSDMVDVGCPPEVHKNLMEIPFDHQPEFIRKTYLTLDCCAVSQLAEWEGSGPAHFARQQGIYDNWGINGRNWSDCGMAVLVNRARAHGFSPHEYEACTRISAHLGAAYRLRSKLDHANALASAEAIIDPRGKIDHAAGAALTRDAQAALLLGARKREHARREQRTAAGLAAWTGRIDARWTLIEHIERDGKRYILAQENEQRPCEARDLSARERQVMVEASLGRTNKEIAYSLGLAASTVRVLLGRAAAKLEVRTRTDAISRFVSLQKDKTSGVQD